MITGPNGSGKSTFLGLISGVFYPTEGLITTYSDKYGYVGPNPLILNSTLRENLLYGNKNLVDDDELIKQLKLFKTFKSDSDFNL